MFLQIITVNNPREINILHDVSANYRSFNIPDDYEDQSFEETCNLLNEGILPQVPLHLDPKMKNLLTNFLKKIYNEKHIPTPAMFHCPLCKKRFLKTSPHPNKITVPEIGRTYHCTQCHSEFEKNKLRLFTSWKMISIRFPVLIISRYLNLPYLKSNYF